MVVNGPITKAIGMNAGINVLGQGNRANATIGRALQLVIRNVGGGRPGGVDRATLGNPGKYTFCFAEDEAGSPWEPLHVERGLAPDASAVTLFAGRGVRGMVDQLSREPESLARVARRLPPGGAAPEAGARLRRRPRGLARARARVPRGRLVEGPAARRAAGAAPARRRRRDPRRRRHRRGPARRARGRRRVPKFRDGGLLLVHAGGGAGLFSAIIGGWVNGPGGSQPVTREVRP